MGYAGYVPAKYAPPPASAQQAALAKVKSLESLDVIGKLVRNIVVAPAEEKFRRVKLTNAKVSSALADDHALDAMLALGWVSAGAGAEEPEVLVAQRTFTMAEVRLVEDAKDALKKKQREELTKTVRQRSREADRETEREEVRAALAADRAERSGAEPSKGSRAQALLGGAKLATAGDLGLNTGGCC